MSLFSIGGFVIDFSFVTVSEFLWSGYGLTHQETFIRAFPELLIRLPHVDDKRLELFLYPCKGYVLPLTLIAHKNGWDTRLTSGYTPMLYYSYYDCYSVFNLPDRVLSG